MIVSELIELLSKIDPNVRVFTCGYEGGYDDATPTLTVQRFSLNVNDAWYYGKHEMANVYENSIDAKDKETVLGIIIN